ncbi:MFS transporter [Mucilaginibacter limnophilus]|uniref:MFS transporter n=1 Tax=Mucilaginibacter limnophilus TaxID=1932778 RepID=A0A3S2UL09_9SPHI|nr:MFS transporter [Mucilaginibacter limnophilus]RVU00309.1 MFS transporter [Mucilaginibacter limnophilus]
MGKLKDEYNFFCSQPRPMRMLLLTNMVYAFALPVIELFIGAYIIRKSNDVSLVMVYQLAQGTGIPITFMMNGYLLRRFPISRLYALGMIISGIDMGVMMLFNNLNLFGVGLIGLIMGLSYGFFWANRVFLALNSTRDDNRNYYYGLETFFFTVASIIMPLVAGYFIASTQKLGWFGGHATTAYHFLTVLVILLTITASVIVHKGRFQNPVNAKFLYWKFHHLWDKMLALAALKGVAQGFIIAAPVMLIMKLVGEEGSVGSIQSTGSLLSAVMLYILGRKANPSHRVKIFAAGLLLFVVGAAVNMFRFDALGAIIFVGCLVFARPLLDLAYFPIQLGVIECVASKEKRNQFAYIFSHEVGIYVGRLFGCLLFIMVARYISEDAALRYALIAVALVQALSIFVARAIINDNEWCEMSKKQPLAPTALKEPVELS